MSKVIAITGSPSSGKTVVGVKLAQEIQRLTKKPVIFLSLDMSTPTMSAVFPNRRDKDLQSFGELYNMVYISQTEILGKMVTTKAMPNLGFLGFMGKDNRYSYPSPTSDKLTSIFDSMSKIAEYIVVDIPNEDNNVAAQCVLLMNDVLIQLGAANFKSIAWYNSQKGLLPDTTKEKLMIVNNTTADVYAPVGETKDFFDLAFGKADFTLPYSRSLRHQEVVGNLMDELKDTRYRRVMRRIAERVTIE